MLLRWLTTGRTNMTAPLCDNKVDFEFAFLGAGAIGSILGAHLARAGHSVVMLARSHRARQIQTDGLRITGLVEFSAPVRTLCDVSQLRNAEVLIVAMKALGTADTLAKLRHVHIGAALSIQNGPWKNHLLASVFGSQRVLGSLADTSGEMLTSGEVVFTRNVNVLVGELSGEASPRAQHIARTIDTSGVRAAAAVNIQGLEWSKFAAWVGLMALSVTTRRVTWSYLADPGSALVLARLVREMGLLAHALGIALTDKSVLPVATICRGTEGEAVDAVMKVGREFELNARQHRMSSLQDLEAGRPLEIHETLGYALQKAAHYKIACPWLTPSTMSSWLLTGHEACRSDVGVVTRNSLEY
jgi:2-dehydropantoate 2-reductase